MNPAEVVGYHLPFAASLAREYLLPVLVEGRVKGSPGVGEPVECGALALGGAGSRHDRSDELMGAVVADVEEFERMYGYAIDHGYKAGRDEQSE